MKTHQAKWIPLNPPNFKFRPSAEPVAVTDAGKAPRVTYRKSSFEEKVNDLIPQGESYTVRAFELWRESEGGWSVNDGWTIASNVDRESAIEALRGRWEIFKLNYLPKARVSDIQDIADMEGESKLEVDCTAFADIEIEA